MPLHLFEPRYLRMMEDILAANETHLLTGTLVPGWEDNYFDEPKLHPIAGLGKLQHVESDAAGNFNLVLRGVRRVRILAEPESENPSTPYRKVLIDQLQEIEVSSTEAPDNARSLLNALEVLSGFPADHAAGRSINYLADVLLVQLPLSMQDKLDLFAICDARERALSVLEAWKSIQAGTTPPPAQPGPSFDPNNN